MYALRRSNSADAEFVYQAVKTTMREFAILTWGVWLEKECKQSAAQDTDEGKIQIILVDDVEAGTLQYQTTETEISLKQIYLLPQFQHKGIGRAIISDLKRDAVKLKFPIRLSVLQVNSAKEFYLKNGFTITGQTKERIYMQYMP